MVSNNLKTYLHKISLFFIHEYIRNFTKTKIEKIKLVQKMFVPDKIMLLCDKIKKEITRRSNDDVVVSNLNIADNFVYDTWRFWCHYPSAFEAH